ncbi:hypothetical protein EBT16_05025, partial [bacterium]|nr:hypothetical protein [bacterium]
MLAIPLILGLFIARVLFPLQLIVLVPPWVYSGVKVTNQQGVIMSHLRDIGMGYFGHLALAWINALRLLASSFFLVVHGLMPFLLVHAASETIAKVRNSFPKAPTDRILVRFNTKWRDDPEGRQWRVLVNGEETLASRVTIRT